MTNKKYEITDIAHEKYPFLYRIRARQGIGDDVKAGDLGGFVESEENLSFEPGDTAWLYDDAIAAGKAIVDKGSRLRNKSVACEQAYVSQGSVMSDASRAEGDSYLRGAVLKDHARASGNSMILNSPDNGSSPCLSGESAVYGTVLGKVQVTGKAVLFAMRISATHRWTLMSLTSTADPSPAIRRETSLCRCRRQLKRQKRKSVQRSCPDEQLL